MSKLRCLANRWTVKAWSARFLTMVLLAVLMLNMPPGFAAEPVGARLHGVASDTDEAEPVEPLPAVAATPPAYLRSVAAVIELLPDQHLLRAASLTTTVELATVAASLTFHLHPDIQVSEVRVAGRPVRFTRGRGDEVAVDLPVGLGSGPFPITWVYAGDPSNVASARVVWDYLGKQGCYLKSSADYYPHLGLNQPAAADWTITAPASWTIVTQGRLTGCTDLAPGRRQWRYVTDVPADGFSLVGGVYVEASREIDGVKYIVLLRPESADKRFAYLSLLVSVIAHYQERLGRFPFSKMVLAEVEGEFPMGYGSQELLVMTGREFDKFRVDPGFVAHEAAHQWWGNWVMARFPTANWLNEGFATFCQFDYIATRFGEHAFAQALATNVDEYLNVAGSPFDAPITSARLLRSRAYQSVVYNKGAMVLIGLKRWLGPERFWVWLRRHGQRFARRIIGFEEFFADLAVHNPDALAYVRPWLDRPSAPLLTLHSVTWRAVASGGAMLDVVLLQKPDDATATLPLAVPVRVETLSGTFEHVIRCNAATTTFSLAVPAPPLRVRVDTLGEVLARLEERRPLTASAPARASSSVVLVYGAGDVNPRVNAFMRLWANELKGRGAFALVTTDRDLTADLSSATGILLLGTSLNNRAVASLTGTIPVTAAPGVVGWRGQQFAGPGASLVARFPVGDTEVVWFAPTDLLAWQRFDAALPRDGNLRVAIGNDVVFEGWLPGIERSSLVGGPLGGAPAAGFVGLRR